jgi:hypothetical protein
MSKRLILSIVSVAVILTAASAAIAQNSAEEDAAQRLAGTLSRQWIYERVVRTMGPNDACSSGETYTFMVDHSLKIEQCQKGHLVATRHSWSITGASGGDTIVTIDWDTTYLLLFRDPPEGGHFMRLRTKNKIQTEPVVDREFRLNED